MNKRYQKRKMDMPETGGIAVPQHVSVAMEEIAANMQEGLLALAVGTGLQVMHALMDEDVTVLCGPRGKHDPSRVAVRHGRQEDGSVTLGGRRIPVKRPRVRAAPSYNISA